MTEKLEYKAAPDKDDLILEEEMVTLKQKYPFVVFDSVFKKIIISIEEGWGNLEPKQKKLILQLTNDLAKNLTDYHYSYTNLKDFAKRTKFYVVDPNKYRTIGENVDRREKELHNAFLDSINILSRNMKKVGLDNSWRAMDKIHGLTPETMRKKAKHWMFEIFKEEILNVSH